MRKVVHSFSQNFYKSQTSNGKPVSIDKISVVR